jgi:hypothetical protein
VFTYRRESGKLHDALLTENNEKRGVIRLDLDMNICEGKKIGSECEAYGAGQSSQLIGNAQYLVSTCNCRVLLPWIN